jgi:hypothetical protein
MGGHQRLDMGVLPTCTQRAHLDLVQRDELGDTNHGTHGSQLV